MTDDEHNKMSSQNRSVSGGVRNLRAMFENKDDAAPPPDRGRSPAGSPGNNSDQNRPLSKVRTSFVAVDRNAQSALRKEAELNSAEATSNTSNSPPAPSTPDTNSSGMSFSKRRSSFSINEDLNPMAVRERRESIAEEFEARRESQQVTETIPEAAIETPSLEPGPEKQLGAAAALPARPRPPMAKNSPLVQPKARRPSTLETLDGSRPVVSNDINVKKTRRGSMAVTEETPEAEPSAESTTNGSDDSDKSVEKTTPKSSPKSSSSEELKPSGPAKSPIPPKTPTSPKKTAAKPATKPAASSKPEKKPSRPSSAATLKTSPPGPKPKAKSPTRPVKLPSSLMAPTAASVKKTSSSTPPVSMKSDAKPAGTASKTGLGRKPSTLKKDTAEAKTPVKRSTSRPPVQRSSSKPPVQRSGSKPPTQRSSSKPPASRSAADDSRPKSRVSGATKEGFLERMMRPTAASAQKISDKPASPPKRTKSAAKRPGTQNGYRSSGSPEARKSKSASPEKPRKESLEEHEKQEGEDAVVMQALMDGHPVEEAIEELTVENEKHDHEAKKSQKPHIASTRPVEPPKDPPVDPETAGPGAPLSATGVINTFADSPLKAEVKLEEPSAPIPRKSSSTQRPSDAKPIDPFQALKETPSMSTARKGAPSSGEGNAIKPTLAQAYDSGSAIDDDDLEDIPMPIPSKSSAQKPEEASVPEEPAFNKAAVEKEISTQTKQEVASLKAEETTADETKVEAPKVEKHRAIHALKSEDEQLEAGARKDTVVGE